MTEARFSLQHFVRTSLFEDNAPQKILLHSCCAPCSGEVIEGIQKSGVDLTIYFYNPNIHPKKEYDLRKEENIIFAKKYNIPFVDADYDSDTWYELTKGLENEPERGKRCTVCFDMRFLKTAKYAKEHGFEMFTSCLGISRWKNMAQINDCGARAAKVHGVSYWDYNWRKQGGSQRMIEIAKREKMYMQEYCGCSYSLRDTNAWRVQKGEKSITIGKKYYGVDDEKDGSC